MIRSTMVRSAAALALVLGAGFGCDDDEGESGPQVTVPASQGQIGESCRARNDCAEGLACIRDMCVADEFPISPTALGCDVIECNAVADCVRLAPGCEDLQTACGEGQMAACEVFEQDCNFVCEANRCESRCADDADCGAGFCQGGQCVQCMADEDCGEGFLCRRGLCLEPCADDLACPLFHACVDGECAPSGCQSDRECVAALRHVEARCVDGACAAPCVTDADCDERDDYDFMKCVDGICQHAGCASDAECRARLFGEGPVEADVLDVVCRDRPEP